MSALVLTLGKRTLFALMLVFATALVTLSARAVEIQTVKSDTGVTALLVEDYTVPLIALQFSFKGGSSQDLPGKEGTAQVLSTLLDEGADDISSEDFQSRLDDNGMSYRFSARTDSFSGGIKTLKERADDAFNLLALMLNKPRFDTDPVSRMKTAALTSLKKRKDNPEAIASDALRETIMAGHPYARPSLGTLNSVENLSAADFADYHRRVFARDNVVVGVVGSISADELKVVLDRIFGELPQKAELSEIPHAPIQTGKLVHIDFDVPQTAIRLALPGISRDDPDFFAAYLVNHILGGGTFSSRLYSEVREKRGLAYGAYSYLGTYDHAAFVGAGSATSSDRADETITVMRDQIRRMAEEGPSLEEFETAKKYIIGSYAIANLDTSDKIASTLVAIQDQDLGTDYIDRRADYISAVTLEDARRVAKELLSLPLSQITVGQKQPKISN